MNSNRTLLLSYLRHKQYLDFNSLVTMTTLLKKNNIHTLTVVKLWSQSCKISMKLFWMQQGLMTYNLFC